MERCWWKEAVIYQIYPRSFYDSNGDGIGDLPGITAKLDYLKDLGIDIIWLCPIYQSPNDDNGYDISDYYQIMAEFGTMADFDRLLAEAHRRGLRIILDLVINHTSDEHPWFQESRATLNNPKRDWYIWRSGQNGRPPNNWRSFFTPSAWEYDPRTSQYYLHLFSRKQPDLNWLNPEVKTEVFKMIRWWLDKGIDGFRMDVINMLIKAEGFPEAISKTEHDQYILDIDLYTNQPGVHQLLQELNESILSHYDILTVGETPNVTPETAALYVGEDRQELNLIFQFELMKIDSGENGKFDLKPWSLEDLKRVVTEWELGLADRGWNSWYLNNHDQARMVSRFGDDQKYRKESAKMLATLLHTLQGTPFIYQGEEIGMTNVAYDSIADYQDIEALNLYHERVFKEGANPDEVLKAIYARGRDNARSPMQWSSAENAGFTTGSPWLKVNPNYLEINLAEALNDPQSVCHYYRGLIQLRKANPVLIYGKYQPLAADDPHFFTYLRIFYDDRLIIILNFTAQTLIFHPPTTIPENRWEFLIGNYTDSPSSLEFKPYEARVYRLN